MSVAPPRRSMKRGPSVLVTDAREAWPASRPQPQRTGTRLISVDGVLQYASEIPSAQRRGPPGLRPPLHTRTPSGRHPLDPKLSGRGVALSPASAHVPARSSKTSEKLVLLPEAGEEQARSEKEGFDGEEDEDDVAPPSDAALQRRRQRPGGKSVAERLPKSQRTAEAQLARVTAYCTAQSYKLRSTAAFVRDQHGAKTKLYDDCLYCVYQLPLLGGNDGYRVRSSPVLKTPGGRSVLDEQIEANERRQYRDGWHEESDEYSVPLNAEQAPDRRDGIEEANRRFDELHTTESSEREQGEDVENADSQQAEHDRQESTDSTGLELSSPQPGISPDAYDVAELFVYSYGVVVLWNFSHNQEKDLLADLTFSSSSALNQMPSSKHGSPNNVPPSLSSKAAALAPPSTLPLMTRPLDEDDFETEEFHFQYDAQVEKPRIFNDMITLRTSDHMVKLAMSHAIAQSTKLSFFEALMQRTMTEAQSVPKRLALEGTLGLTRTEVVKLLGRLFEGRVGVNLSSSVLDTPAFFWDTEPTLHPLYAAVREYLEIKPRIDVLNKQSQVFLDLTEILSESISHTKMTRITYIIIVLIVVSIFVTCTEVVLRWAILAREKWRETHPPPSPYSMGVLERPASDLAVCGLSALGAVLEQGVGWQLAVRRLVRRTIVVS